MFIERASPKLEPLSRSPTDSCFVSISWGCWTWLLSRGRKIQKALPASCSEVRTSTISNIVPATYPRQLRFDSRPDKRLSWLYFIFFSVTKETQDWYITNREREHRLPQIPLYYNLQFIAHLAHTASLTLRRLMSYIHGAPIFDVSRSHTTTQHSR